MHGSSENDVLLALGQLTEFSFLQVQTTTSEGLPTYDEHRLVPPATPQL